MTDIEQLILRQTEALESIAESLEKIAGQSDSSIDNYAWETGAWSGQLRGVLIDPWYAGTPYMDHPTMEAELSRYITLYMNFGHLGTCICNDVSPNEKGATPCQVEIARRIDKLKALLLGDYRVNLNTGHGDVYPRPDGILSKCGGPSMCSECAKDLAKKEGRSQ